MSIPVESLLALAFTSVLVVDLSSRACWDLHTRVTVPLSALRTDALVICVAPNLPATASDAALAIPVVSLRAFAFTSVLVVDLTSRAKGHTSSAIPLLSDWATDALIALGVGVRRAGLVALSVVEVGVVGAVIAGWVVEEEIAEGEVREGGTALEREDI